MNDSSNYHDVSHTSHATRLPHTHAPISPSHMHPGTHRAVATHVEVLVNLLAVFFVKALRREVAAGVVSQKHARLWAAPQRRLDILNSPRHHLR